MFLEVAEQGQGDAGVFLEEAEQGLEAARHWVAGGQEHHVRDVSGKVSY